jgi:CO dehydrogenase/acetyl-CoA synthase gamma subunit (corrinoid Fe-S protein)
MNLSNITSLLKVSGITEDVNERLLVVPGLAGKYI